MGRRLRAVLTLYRWDSSFALAVLFLAASPQPARAASLAGAIAWFFTAAGAYALNDAMDVEIDRVNHAERPVPAGELSVGAAKVAAAIAFVLALLATAFDTGLLMWILPCPVVAVLFLHRRSKKVFARVECAGERRRRLHSALGCSASRLARSLRGAVAGDSS